jgi:hypothetical protein
MATSFTEAFLASASPDDLRNIVLELDRRLGTLEKSFLQVQQLGEISGDLGDVQFRAVDDNAVVRTILSARNLFDEFGINAHLAGFDAEGYPMFWISSDTGAATFLAGNAVIDNGGILITLAGPVIRSVVGARAGSNVMELMPGQSLYSYLMKYYNDGGGTELVTNGDFPTDLTSWVKTSETDGVWSVVNGQARFTFTALSLTGPDGILTQRVAVSAGVQYNFSARGLTIDNNSYMPSGKVQIKWYDSAVGGNLLRTDTLGDFSAAYLKFTQTLLSPAGAAGADITLAAGPGGDVGEYVVFDDVSLQVAGVSGMIGFEPIAGEPVAQRGKTVGSIPVVSRQIQPYGPMVSLTTGPGGSVDLGKHYYKFTYYDAYGETTPNGLANDITVVAGVNKTVVVSVPLGPAGTVGRRIYRTAAGAANIPGNFKLAGTQSDNLSQSFIDSVADAALGAVAPTVNTTGSVPAVDRLGHIMGDEMLSDGTGSWSPTVVDASQAYGFRAVFNPGADGAALYGRVWLDAGTYTFKYMGTSSTNRAKTDIYLDSTAIASGLDWYAASQTYNVVKTASAIVVATPGYHHLRIVLNGRNASNTTGWVIDVTKIWFVPAGF